MSSSPVHVSAEVTVRNFYGSMNRAQSVEMVAHLKRGGYLTDAHAEVDDWYSAASEGQREHMANKLAKHGYPKNGIHSGRTIRELKASGLTLEDFINMWVTI